jgi:hypothetical protein
MKVEGKVGETVVGKVEMLVTMRVVLLVVK